MTIDIERLKTDLDYWNSIAPEGATHAAATDCKIGHVFYRIRNETAYDFNLGTGWRTNPGKPCYEGFPRPSPTWNGEGLPPVGVECEFLWGGVSQGVVEIIQYRGSKAIFWRKEKDHVDSAELPTAAFRPLKTEKERVVEAALAMDEYPRGQSAGGMMSRKDFCDALYDAGALKMPGGE